MISSIQSNATWLPASHSSQVSRPEVLGDHENDGDSDDVAAAGKPAASQSFPLYMGNRINTLA
ncbi:MAG TPA: hypothetical protein VL354_14700 [Spirochaetia bacterium]|nr:hypothetical protein [Spirochaetia bacterium]